MRYLSTFMVVALWGLAPVVLAAGSTSNSTQTTARPSLYDEAVKAVEGRAYRRALRLLGKVLDAEPRNADAWNYAGFSHRQLKEFDAALRAYQRALAIEPEHRGANEYLGELYLKMGELAKAKERREKLDEICRSGCEEYEDLDAAIKAYESG